MTNFQSQNQNQYVFLEDLWCNNFNNANNKYYKQLENIDTLYIIRWGATIDTLTQKTCNILISLPVCNQLFIKMAAGINDIPTKNPFGVVYLSSFTTEGIVLMLKKFNSFIKSLNPPAAVGFVTILTTNVCHISDNFMKSGFLKTVNLNNKG